MNDQVENLRTVKIHEHECPQRIRAEALLFALERIDRILDLKNWGPGAVRLESAATDAFEIANQAIEADRTRQR